MAAAVQMPQTVCPYCGRALVADERGKPWCPPGTLHAHSFRPGRYPAGWPIWRKRSKAQGGGGASGRRRKREAVRRRCAFERLFAET